VVIVVALKFFEVVTFEVHHMHQVEIDTSSILLWRLDYFV